MRGSVCAVLWSRAGARNIVVTALERRGSVAFVLRRKGLGSSRRLARHIRRVSALGLLALLASAGAAAAKSAAEKGWEYTTEEGATTVLTFKVSSSGKAIEDLSIPNAPAHCQGGGFGGASGGTAPIKKNGSFKVTLKIMSPLPSVPGGVSGTMVVSGKFKKGGSESGSIKALYTASTFSGCNTTVKYYTESVE